MATLSAETQAIIERLKAEGDLLRNSGTNSIRSVKIEMAKFQGVFDVISANVVEQTKILQMQAGLAQEAVEIRRTKEQFDELEKEREEKKSSQDDTSESKTDKKIDDIGDKISSALSLKNLALAGAGLFVGYNLLKGFIDEKTDGGFTALETSIGDTDWAALSEKLTNLTNGAQQFLDGMNGIDWASLSAAVNLLSSAVLNFGDWMEEYLPGILVGGILGSIARGALRGSIEGLINGTAGGRRGRGGNAPRINPTHRTAIRAGIAGIVAAGVIVFGDQVRNWVNQQEWSNNEIAGARVGDVVSGGIDIAQGAAMGASIGMFFGPGGALAGAILGGSVTLGLQLYNWYQGKREERAAELAADMAAADRIMATRRAEFEQLAQDMANLTPEDQATRTEGMSNAEIIALNRVIEENPVLSLIEELNYQMGEIQRFRQMGNESQAALMETEITNRTDPESLFSQTLAERDRLNAIAESMEVDGQRREGVSEQDYLAVLDMLSRANNIINTMLGIAEPIATGVEGYRTGTPGFLDFGSGQYAILHGREAVVPLNTAAGRFLDQYFTENWEPKTTDVRRLDTVASGSGTGGGAFIISAPTNVSPVVNNVSGGKSVNQISVRGGGGGGSWGVGANPYGLPTVAN